MSKKVTLWASITIDEEGWDSKVKALVNQDSEPWQIAVGDIYRAALVEALDQTADLLKDIQKEELHGVCGGSRSVH